MATEIYPALWEHALKNPALWEHALKKFAANSRVTSEMRDDFKARAAHLAQPRVDELVRADQTVNGAAANRLIVDAATIAAHMVLRSIRQRNLS
ncbi:hypothetical protein [Lacipirellula limnantheis]|uniref:hypothetical protein n=1 Tax=Lacipirellula limnantheis TaxID=2528024 RepID=UPI0011AA7A96|nr:hypothetical protein [Lacipirellula limnantheis]